MVDFNNDTTITGRSAEDILRVIIMERRYNLFESIENYVKLRSQDNENYTDLAIIKARLYTLFLEIEETIKRNLKDDSPRLDLLYKYMESDKYEELIKAVKIVLYVLDSVKLTRLDTRVPYDVTRVAVEDKVKGH